MTFPAYGWQTLRQVYIFIAFCLTIGPAVYKYMRIYLYTADEQRDFDIA
jgi:hypothetical protein